MTPEQLIYKIQRYSIHDGPGIRTTLFFQGCPLSCQWCHNPESQAMPETAQDTDLDIAAGQVIGDITKDILFYDESGGGVTFSGGEPLGQTALVCRLLEYCKNRGIHTCLDTSGFASWDHLSRAASLADLIHFDVKLIDDMDHKSFTGVSSELILDNLRRLALTASTVRLRFPLIPKITDTRKNLEDIVSFITANTHYRELDILPYHDTGRDKYNKLGLPFSLDHIRPPDAARIKKTEKHFESGGFKVTIGG